MFKKVTSILLALVMLAALACVSVPGAYADESPTGKPGKWLTYYFLAPEKFFTSNESCGFYYWQPAENAAWPGVELTVDSACDFKYPDGCRVYKAQVWQNDEDTQEELFTTSMVLFNSFVDARIDPANGHQTANINVEGYEEDELADLDYGADEMEFPRYKEEKAIPDFDGMIYVPNMALSSINPYSEAIEIGGGVWYYYWGNGEYGVTKEKPSDYAGNTTHDKKEYSLGDVTADGSVKMDDVVKVQKYIAELITFSADETKAADVSKDGSVKMEDVVIIQKYIAELISSF